MRFLIATLPLFSLGCGGTEDDGSANCSTEWSCVNEVCECQDGTACEDADDCDQVCEVCDPA